ncbi:hypothetical protein [Pseudoalteromonas sp. P1-16-1b]|uniref:hypothetical protein n=1 Tax=Pseudoalteromonas sp. P1-16-1b TaxID=1723757 RepID=UPI0019107E90|nr:hypothetical protein [Pseudoalteromonas sp. P1-16-1b]
MSTSIVGQPKYNERRTKILSFASCFEREADGQVNSFLDKNVLEPKNRSVLEKDVGNALLAQYKSYHSSLPLCHC